jgi:hypothetical protein
VGGNRAEDGAVPGVLLVVVAAEARLVLVAVGEVEVAALLEVVPAVLLAEFLHHAAEAVALEHAEVGERVDLAVEAQLGELAFGQVEVRGAGLQHLVEESVEDGHGSLRVVSIGL